MNIVKRIIIELCRRLYHLSNLIEIPFIIRDFKTLLEFKRKNIIDKKDLFDFARRLKIGQRQEEIEWVADLLVKYKVQNLIEIGTQKGGSAFYLANFMPPKSRLITIDIAPRIVFEMDSHNYRLMRSRKKEARLKIRKDGIPFSRGCTVLRRWLIKHFSNRNCQVIPFYTYLAPEEDASLISTLYLDGREFDSIFYDADKSEYGVKAILKAYLPYLRQGGLLMIQDINYALDSGNNGMALYWNSIDKSKFRIIGEHITAPPGKGSGIGAAIKL